MCRPGLSQDGDCWVGGDAILFGNAKVEDNATIGGKCSVSGNVVIGGNAKVHGKAFINSFTEGRGIKIHGHTIVEDNVSITGNNIEICGHSQIYGKAVIFNDVYINDSKVGESATVGNGVAILPYSHISGSTKIIGKRKLENPTFVRKCLINSNYATYYCVDELADLVKYNYEFIYGWNR